LWFFAGSNFGVLSPMMMMMMMMMMKLASSVTGKKNHCQFLNNGSLYPAFPKEGMLTIRRRRRRRLGY